MWGASTSSHQVEGHNVDNDWWEWEQAGNTEPSLAACDHYNRFREDFDIAKKLGHNAHRLGLEWSRLEKEEGVWDEAEWDHYKTVMDELLRRGIEPIVTLHHFTLPAWLSHSGGWLNKNASRYFTRFAAKAMSELGGKVRYWITINEPHILAFLSYFTKEWPPCRNDLKQALTVLEHMLISHTEAYLIMKEFAEKNPGCKKPSIGLAKAVTAFHPNSSISPLDWLMTCLRSKFHNHDFIRSLIKGRILIPGIRRKKLSASNTLDFIGLNYYFRQFIGFPRNFVKGYYGDVCPTEPHKDAGPLTDMGWEIYPRGIYEVVKSLSRHNLPMMIAENGLATTDDAVRREYIKTHLTQILNALRSGYPIIGYLHWSLLDNFEWAEGYSKRFGLVEVDYQTQKRTIKDSARYYEKVIRSGQIAE